MPFVILGDNACPLKMYLMKPFARKDVSCEEDVLKCGLPRVRRCVECAFGILTAKWRLLNKTIETNVNKTERIVRCTCLLHNIITDLEGTTHDPSVQHKLHKFLYPVRPKQMSAADQSVRKRSNRCKQTL